MNFTQAQINSGRDASVVSRATSIHETASAVVASLGDYGIDEEQLTELSQLISQFDAVRTKLRQVTATSSAATRQSALRLCQGP